MNLYHLLAFYLGFCCGWAVAFTVASHRLSKHLNPNPKK